jgi:hypothetical protein
VHRRLVRQAIGNALAPVRKVAEREGPVLTKALQGVIDGWLGGDREVPRKQHHTGRRIFQLLQGEYGYPGAESTVRRYIGRWRRELSLACVSEIWAHERQTNDSNLRVFNELRL